MPRIRYCSQQTQVAIAPDCGVLDPVVEQSYVNSTQVVGFTFYNHESTKIVEAKIGYLGLVIVLNHK